VGRAIFVFFQRKFPEMEAYGFGFVSGVPHSTAAR
jgi:hypothetical protein